MVMNTSCSTPWRWIGDFQLGDFGIFSVWERYDERFRRRYVITPCRTYPKEEGQLGPRYRVIQKFIAKYPVSAKFYWIAGDYRAIHSW